MIFCFMFFYLWDSSNRIWREQDSTRVKKSSHGNSRSHCQVKTKNHAKSHEKSIYSLPLYLASYTESCFLLAWLVNWAECVKTPSLFSFGSKANCFFPYLTYLEQWVRNYFYTRTPSQKSSQKGSSSTHCRFILKRCHYSL